MYGDIVTYEDDEDYFVTHRIIEKNGNSFITKGDKNNEVDTQIFNPEIYGKVVFHSKILGNFVRFYLKYVFIIFTIFIIILNIYNSRESKKRDENEEDEKIQS